MHQIIKASNVAGVDPKKLELENLFISYINNIIKFDISIGRDSKNFYEDEYKMVLKNISNFKNQGFRVFIGGGNIFLLKIELKLTGWIGNCFQIRGLAQRKIQIKEMAL